MVGIGCEREKIKIIVPFRSNPTRNRKFQKNSKNIIIVSFEAKIGWGRMRKRENENYRSVSLHSCATRNRKFQKNRKKNSKNSKIPLWIRLKPKLVGKRCERSKIKIIVPFCSHPMRNGKIQKK